MIWHIAIAAFSCPLAMLAAHAMFRLAGIRRPMPFLSWAAGEAVQAAALASSRLWPDAAAAGVSLAIAPLLWWRRKRKNRRRIAELLGAKSRALLAALARKARDASRPRPALRPVPGGAAG